MLRNIISTDRLNGWAAGLVLLVGAALLAAAGPRGLGALAARPSRPVILELGRGQRPDSAALTIAIEALERATSWRGSAPNTYGDLALLKLERARREVADPEFALSEIEAGVSVQRVSLALSPSSASGWARLVYAEQLREEKLRAQQAWALNPDGPLDRPPDRPPDGPSEGAPAEIMPHPLVASRLAQKAAALEALEMAFLTRDLSFSLVRFRLGAALARWSELPPWMQRAARAEILQLTRYGRRGMEALVDFYLAPPGPQAVELIERELAADPKREAFFIKRLNRRRSS